MDVGVGLMLMLNSNEVFCSIDWIVLFEDYCIKFSMIDWYDVLCVVYRKEV